MKYLTDTNIHFISSKRTDYAKLKEMNERNEISNENIILPTEKEQQQIEQEIGEFIKAINKDINKYPLFNITKESLSTFIIRRFYFKTRYFRYQNFFNNDLIQLTEYNYKDFIILRDITTNTSLSFYKPENHLYVIKRKENYINNESFERERDLYNRINKLNNFLKCYGYIKNKSNEVTCLVLEFMSRGTIEEYISQKKRKIDKFKMSFQILEGLHLLHSNDMIHRDLKPDNIFINHDFNVFLGDFESSRYFSDTTTNFSEMTKDIGSIIYASPEMINSKEYNKSTDIYSYGLVLYFIFTGEHPYKTKSENEIINLKNDPNHHYNDDKISEKLIKNLYIKCTSFNPKERPSLNHIFEYFINESYDMPTNYQFIFYLYGNDDPFIEQKFVKIYNSKMNTQINKIDLIKCIMKRIARLNPLANCSQALVNEIIKLANKNNYSAQMTLNLIYMQEGYIKGGIKENFNSIKTLANKNNSSIQYIVGRIFYEGQYVEFDLQKSLHYFTLSANLNNTSALNYLGLIYFNNEHVSRDINKSIHYLTLSAKLNDQRAQYFLGELYYNGCFIERDINQAIYYFTLSANQNNSLAQFFLGEIYYLGEFIGRDINQAIYYFTLSANQNYSLAQFFLGEIYILGEFIGRDIKKGIHFFTMSANLNNQYAQYILGILYLEGKYINRNINKSIQYLTNSANQNCINSMILLGHIYYNNEYVKQDIQKSIHFFTAAANQNCSEAQYLLGIIFFQNKYQNRDIGKSIYYLTLSARQNNSYAQFALGHIHYYGIDVAKDINKAIFYFQQSANLNNNEAQCALGCIYSDKNLGFFDIS